MDYYKNKVEALAECCSTSSSQEAEDVVHVQATNLQEVVAAERKRRRSSMYEKLKKLKASNFPISSISIGSWKRVSGHIQGELTAKIYYAKRKLVWEFLDGNLKSKMEISWSDIIAIKALIHPHQPSILEIELSNPPLFFREQTPQPRKHTIWQRSSDFTNGQALLCRRHYVSFPPGALDKHYEDLLKCDPNLLKLSMSPFPTHQSPHFDTVIPPSPPVSNINEEQTIIFRNQPQLHYPIASIPSPPPLPLPLTRPLITAQDLGFVNFPNIDEMAARSLSMNNQPSSTMRENHQAAGLLSNARVLGSLPAEERQLPPPYHHHFYEPPPPPMAPEEYGCDLDFLSPLYPECNPIPHSNTSYGMIAAADHEQVVMMQNDHIHSSMFPMFPPPPPPPPPHIQGGGCSHGAIPRFGYINNGLGDEGLEQILYSSHRPESNDDQVQVQVQPPPQ